ncbi:MAG: ThuA domain-containing protein [Micromonosporaceae bacterium]|nr:ThuA domain-containing protein [Micromonosporaceae bacterium]
MSTGENRNALVVWGGWDGHEPERAVALFLPFLAESGFTVRVETSFEVYTDEEVMGAADLIVQCVTDGKATGEQVGGLVRAVAAGTGLAGWHGGLVDSLRADTDYQFLTGGQFVAHPGDIIDYTVEIAPGHQDHPIVAGIGDFTVTTEQYYLHFDPANQVLATTTFTHPTQPPEVTGAVMPVVWTRRWGHGRVFASTLGHSVADLEVPQVNEITRRGLVWAARQEPEQGAR